MNRPRPVPFVLEIDDGQVINLVNNFGITSGSTLTPLSLTLITTSLLFPKAIKEILLLFYNSAYVSTDNVGLCMQ
jgi:hypothetical protein